MSVSLQNCIDNLDDYSASESGQVNQDRKIRAINRAIEYFQRKLALPSDRKINSFYWSDDQYFYPVPTGFMEERQLVYNNAELNTSADEFHYKPDIELLRRTGDISQKNEWCITAINGSNQLFIKGNNQEAGSTIENFDAVGDWTITDDGSSLTQDLLQKKIGDGSLSFDITDSAGVTTLKKTTFSLDVKTLFEKHGYFKFWNFMTNTNISSVAIKLVVNASNYWTITETDLDDGSAYSANAWKKIGFPLDNAVKTGSPAITDKVTEIHLIWNQNASMTSAVDFRADHLYTTIPDYLDFIYQSRYKGTDSTGATDRENLTTTTDLLSIGDEIPDFVDHIARRAAIQLFPGLRGDPQFLAFYKSELQELIKDFGLIHPRYRNPKNLSTRLTR